MNLMTKSFFNSSVSNVLMRITHFHAKYSWKPNRFRQTFSKCSGALTRFNYALSLSTARSSISFYSSQPTETEISLAKVLEKEIISEQESQKTDTIPSKIDDFEVALNGSEVTLTRQLPNETIEINFSVNNTIENNSDQNGESSLEMRSKPIFCVKIITSQSTLGLNCSFVPDDDLEEEEINDVFIINEISIFKKEKSCADYSVAAHLIDYGIYNLLMDWLDEKGITNEFAQKLSHFSAMYEQNLYISILSELRKFVSHSEL